MTVEEFWSKIVKYDHGDQCKKCCWLWKGLQVPWYGRVSWQGRTRTAHNIAFRLFYGEILLTGHQIHIRHQCDNPPCCNPQHLRLGTARDNQRDAKKKGRWNGCENKICSFD